MSGTTSTPGPDAPSAEVASGRRIHRPGTFGVIGLAAFLVCLAVSVYFCRLGRQNPLLDMYGFRQTQTAISSYYMLHEPGSLGDRLFRYQVPVLGKPWSIPFEFPIYQAIVALATRILSRSLDEVGRLVSLAFFYASIVPAFFFLRSLLQSRGKTLLVLAVLLINPIFIFWSRTFMIESSALFFGMCFLAANAAVLGLVRSSESTGKIVIFCCIAAISGIACGLAKLTTFAVFCVGTGAFYFYSLIALEKRPRHIGPVILSYLRVAIPIFGLAILVSFAWVRYSDSLKHLNPLARDFIVSRSLMKWNFGTMGQRFKLLIGGDLISNTYRFGAILFGLVCLLTGKRYHVLALGSLATYLVGPLLFANLYFEHTYYWYASTIFLVFFVGIAALSAIEERKGTGRLVAVLLLWLFGMFSVWCYQQEYFKAQTQSYSVPEAATIVRDNTPRDAVVLVYGDDWSSVIPYYSERKAIMDRWNMKVSDARFQAALVALGQSEVMAMVIPTSYSPDFVAEKVSLFKFRRSIATKDGQYEVYLK